MDQLRSQLQAGALAFCTSCPYLCVRISHGLPEREGFGEHQGDTSELHIRPLLTFDYNSTWQLAMHRLHRHHLYG